MITFLRWDRYKQQTAGGDIVWDGTRLVLKIRDFPDFNPALNIADLHPAYANYVTSGYKAQDFTCNGHSASWSGFPIDGVANLGVTVSSNPRVEGHYPLPFRFAHIMANLGVVASHPAFGVQLLNSPAQLLPTLVDTVRGAVSLNYSLYHCDYVTGFVLTVNYASGPALFLVGHDKLTGQLYIAGPGRPVVWTTVTNTFPRTVEQSIAALLLMKPLGLSLQSSLND